VPRKGRARRFREARELKQGYDDGLFREGSGTLADLDEDEDEAHRYLDDDEDDEDEQEPWDPDAEPER
jgi:hypothetical protein